MKTAILLTVFLALGPVRINAQPFGRESVQCSTEGLAAGVIRGRLVPLSDSIFLNRGVSLSQGDDTLCRLSSDSTGAFEFAAVPSGTYRIEVAGLGLQTLAPISVRTEANDSVFLTIPVRAADEVSECMRDSACAPVLARATSAERRLGGERALSIAGYRLGIALSLSTTDDLDPPITCVPDDVVDVLQEVFDVAPASECAPVPSGAGARGRLHHTPTGRQAIGITLDRVERTGPLTSMVDVSYFVASLWAAGFRCSLKLDRDLWVPLGCRLTWVS